MTSPLEYRLEVVVVPVSDVDRAKAFYVDQVGFHLDVDQKNGDLRVVQMTPNGSACSVTIGIGLADMPPGAVKGLQLVVEGHRRGPGRPRLAGRGGHAGPPPRRNRLGRWARR